MKNPVLIVAASIALVAAAPPPPPPAPVTQATPGTAAATPPPPATQPEPQTTDLNSVFAPSPKPGASGAPAPKATPTPPADDRKGLDGVWEVEIQRGANTEYEHLQIKQTGDAITGVYMTQDKKKYPLAGSLDGHNVRMVVSLTDGSTIVLEGRVDGTTDMLGMLTNATERVPFTAAYRPKEKWIENLNAAPGGLGSPSGGPPQ